MKEWFECKVSYSQEDENGKLKKKKESYLVDAVNFTEAETVITREVSNFISGEFTIDNIKREKVYELVKNSEGEFWYKCKIAFIEIDEVTAKEKKNEVTFYVYAKDTDHAGKLLKDALKDSVIDYVIKGINESKIIEIFEHEDSTTEN